MSSRFGPYTKYPDPWDHQWCMPSKGFCWARDGEKRCVPPGNDFFLKGERRHERAEARRPPA